MLVGANKRSKLEIFLLVSFNMAAMTSREQTVNKTLNNVDRKQR